MSCWLWLMESEHAILVDLIKDIVRSFHVGSQVWQTPEEVRRTHQLKCCGNNNEDEDNSPKTLNDKKSSSFVTEILIALSAVEYTDCTSAEGQDPSPPPSECPGYDTKQSDGEVPAVLELWRMQSTPSLPLLPDPLWPRVIAPDRALSMD